MLFGMLYSQFWSFIQYLMHILHTYYEQHLMKSSTAGSIIVEIERFILNNWSRARCFIKHKQNLGKFWLFHVFPGNVIVAFLTYANLKMHILLWKYFAQPNKKLGGRANQRWISLDTSFSVSGQNSPRQNSPRQNSPKLQNIPRLNSPRQNSPKKPDKTVPDKIVPNKMYLMPLYPMYFEMFVQ